jgi:hypothetical protein
MKNLLFTAVIITLINFTLLGQSAVDIAKNWLPSTVSLVMEDNFKQPLSLGSGFIIGNGKIVTNLHVIEGAKYGSVFISGSSTKHKIEGYFSIDKQNDLAILSVPTLTGKPIQLASINPEVGEKIYAIGNPKGLSGTISEGIVSGIRDLENKKLIQITAPISPGSSGGPVLNNKGEVIGVAVGTLASGQNLNFAIPSSAVNALIGPSGSGTTALNILKGTTEPKIDKSEIDVSEAVVIRDFYYTTNEYFEGACLQSISLLNKSPYTIKIKKILFILYDRTNIPVDYWEGDDGYLFKGSGENIRPFLAKTAVFDGYSGMDCRRRRVLSKKNGEYLKVRVLDFEIIED